MSDDSLKGKAILVTGMGTGLGEATASAFTGAGCAGASLGLNGVAAQRVGE